MAGLLDKLRSIDHRKLFDSMAEPLYGNPWPVYYKNRLISQDLCNSLIEFYSIANSVDFHKPIVIGELGAGYGRLCYVFLKALSNVKYVIFDIPPAIYISQWYLQKVFPDKRIFKLRAFQSFREIQDEYEQCEVAFFLPEQMELFPEKHFHLFVNVSSFGEMRLDQIRNYFSQINRLTHGYLYSKQWITSVNPEDNLVICQEDYPVPQNWATLYRRPAEIQRKFFEALYRID
jgi:putative sugar O-methyltransferase